MLLLALLGAALLNLGVIMATGYGNVVDTKLAEANAPNASSIVPDGPAADRMVALLRADRQVTRMEVEPTLVAMVDTRYGGETVAMSVIISNLDRPPAMGRWRETNRLATPVERPIWAPAIYEGAGGYKLGDPVVFSTPSGTITFHIQGFLEHPTLGMPAMGALGFAVPGDEYATLARDPASGLRPMTFMKIDVPAGVKGFDVLQRAMVAQNRAHPGEPARSVQDSSLDLMRTGATIGSNIFAGGFVVFALIILVVALVVMRFLLMNAISDDMRSLGVLRAVGFGTGAVMWQLAGTFALCALVGAVVGVALSYLVLPGLAGALSAQTGLVWDVGFNAMAAAVTVPALTGAVLLVALLASRRLRRQTTIEAIRGGARTHTFTRNPLPLDRSGGRLNVLLGFKAALQRVPQQALVGITVAVVAFTSMLAVGLIVNVLGDRDAFTNLVVGDFPDAQIALVDEAAVPAVLADARATPGVERAFLSEGFGTTINGSTGSIQVMDDYSVVRHDSTYAGRLPRHADEISLGSSLADRLNARVGERITLDIGGYSAEYLVSGLTSTSRGLGMTADITTAGMRRADPSYRQRVVSMQIAKGQDVDRILTGIVRRHADVVEQRVNTRSNVDGQLSGFQSMVGALSNIIVAFMVAVVILVVALIVSTMVVQGRRSYGVLKAVGFATGDLRRQTLLTWLPVIGLGALVGAVLGVIGLNPAMGAMLRFIGIRRSDFSLDWWLAPALALIITLLAAVVVRIAARGLRKVSAYALVSEG